MDLPLQRGLCGSRARGLQHVGLLVAPRHRDPSSLTRDQTHVPCIVRWILNPWTLREVLRKILRE